MNPSSGHFIVHQCTGDMNSGWRHSVSKFRKHPNSEYKTTFPLLMPMKICPDLKLEENSGLNGLTKNVLV
jgi:hypothetical protein